MSEHRKVTIFKSTLSQLGGLEKYSLHLAQAFSQKKCDVTLLTTGEIPRNLPSSFSTCAHQFSSRLSFRKILEFDRFCQNYTHTHPADILFSMDRNRSQTHLRAGNGVHAAYLACRKQCEGFLKAASFSFNPLHRILLHFEKTAFEDPNLRILFTNSEMVKAQVLSHYRTEPSKIHVVHNGVEWKQMQGAFEESLLKKKEIALKLGLDPNVFHFLFIGNNFQRKGLNLLLQALSQLPVREFHLSIIGKDKNLSQFQTQSASLGLAKQVTFWGARKDVLSFYQVADCLAIPSLYDPFANVTVEALAMGLFVVSSKMNGGHEVLTKENGAVIPDLLDRDSFCESLNLSLKHAKTQASSQRIRSSVQSLDFPNQLDKIVDVCLKQEPL
jgi:UDP-glucose:(heptosyl)LPS alpha-1,3-glucosyltransferase